MSNFSKSEVQINLLQLKFIVGTTVFKATLNSCVMSNCLEKFANNLVKALRLLLADLCPALSVTLEGFQSWVIKGATQPSGWERVDGH